MIDLCSQESSPMLRIEDALARIKNTIHPLKASETVLLKDALGRILLEAVYDKILELKLYNDAVVFNIEALNAFNEAVADWKLVTVALLLAV